MIRARGAKRGAVASGVALVGGLLLAATVAVVAQQPTPAEPRVKALLISSGAFHDYLHQSRVFVEAVGAAVPVDWTIALQGSPRGTTTRYPVYDRTDWAAGFDIVIHNECSADVSDPAFIRRITEAHRTARVPAMVVHCAMHSYRSATVDDWRELLGVTSRVHTPQFRIPVRWGDDPIVRGLPADWVTPMDELYVIEKVWPGVRPIATAVDYRDERSYPVAWVHETGGVRVFGTTLGHGTATWDDPVYQQLLVRGFRWAIGRP
ncbi:MAG: ThuA domain-containing protein [Acidobacteria bacterium]|nr:ThuA domain-containing protein [Acidobacteriota bacterium]